MPAVPFIAEYSSQAPSGSTFLDRMLQRIEKAIGSLQKAVLNESLVTATIGTGDTVVTHGLGAPVQTWEVVDINANAVVWKSATAPSNPRMQIVLKASGTVTVKLRFT